MALGRLGAWDERSLVALGRAALRDPHDQVRRYAARVLRAIGNEGIMDRMPALGVHPIREQTERSVRYVSFQSESDEYEQITRQWERLVDEDPEVRREAVAELMRIDANGLQTIDWLCAVLDDDDPSVRKEVARALGEVHPDHTEAIDLSESALCAVLNGDPNFEVRIAAAVALGQRRTCRAATIEALRRALCEANSDVQHRAAWALVRMGETSAETLGALHEAARAKGSSFHHAAAEALGDVAGRDPAVYRMLQDMEAYAVDLDLIRHGLAVAEGRAKPSFQAYQDYDAQTADRVIREMLRYLLDIEGGT